MAEATNITNPGMAPGQQPGFDQDPVQDTTLPASAAVVIQFVAVPLQIALAGNPGVGATSIPWKQYQTAPMLALCLIDGNGVPINVTGATVRLRLAPRSLGTNIVISEPMTILYGMGGQVGYTFLDADVAQAGTFALEVQVTFGNGIYMYFGSVPFQIYRSLGGP